VNLTELRNKVKAITDYSPELTVYNEQLDMFLNDAYFSLWTMKRWNFAYKTVYKDIIPDVGPTSPTTGATVDALVVNNSREINFSAPLYTLAIPSMWEGQIFQIDNRDYEILKVVGQTQIHLVEPFRGKTTPTNTTWKLKHRFYDLPQDAIELLYIGHRDTPIVGKQPPYGAVRGLLPRRDEDINLKEDYTSFYSECYIPVGTKNVPTAETLSVEIQYDLPWALYPTIAHPQYYEFCWAFQGADGRVGPLSEPKIFNFDPNPEFPAPSIRIFFLTWDGQQVQAPAFSAGGDQIPNPFEGLRKRIYFNQNFNRNTGERLKGLPVWREVTYGLDAPQPAVPGWESKNDPVVVDDEVAFVDIGYHTQLDAGNKRYNEWDGIEFRIRPYPRPIGYDYKYDWEEGVKSPLLMNDAPEVLFRRWEMRYYRRPFPLGLQTDAPEFPMEFHQLIVYKALEDIYLKHDNMNQAGIYRNRYEKELNRLEKRYVDSVDIDVVRQQFGGNYRIWTPFDPNSLRRLN